MEHRLAAILSADAAGYTRLLAEDQAATIRTVAARLQTLAEPGGICLSAAIQDNVQGRLDLLFHDISEQSLENFPRPVRAFRIGSAAGPPAPPEPPDRPSLCAAANPDLFGANMQLAAIHAWLGELNQARVELAELLRKRPDFSIAMVPRVPTNRALLIENLRKAGLRE
jgi:hypothetical protein